MAAVISIRVETSGGLDSVKKDLDDLGKHAKDSGGGFNALQEIATGALRAIGTAAVDLAVKGFQAVAGAISDGIEDAKQNAQIQAQTAQVIDSMGNSAGVTAQHVADLATSLSDAAGASLFGDDQVQEATNMLLTFGNIKGEVLDAATALTVDMGQALKKTPVDMSIMIGKLLNSSDAMSAAKRMGVSFTDEQVKLGKALEEAGDMAGYQSMVMTELNKEFGGSAAAAAAATGGWSEFNGRMGEAKEALGTAVLPLLNGLAGVLNDTVLPIVESAAKAFGTLVQYFQAVAEDGDTLNDFLGNLPTFLQPIVQTIGDVMVAIQGFFASLQSDDSMETLMATTAALTPYIRDVQNAFAAVWTVLQTQVWPILQDLGTALFPLIGAAIQILAGFWTDVLVPAVQMLWSVLTTVVLPILAALAGWLRDNLPGAIQAVADFLTGTLFPALHTVYDFISVNVIPILQAVAQWLIENVPVAIQAASDFLNTVLIPALQAVWAFIQGSVLPLFATLWEWLSTNIPAALQTLANFWTNTLLPAINAVWAFIQTYVIPLVTALVQLHFAVLGLAVRALAAIWTEVLLPGLTAIWTFIKTNLGPVIDWLTVTILQPLMKIIGDLFYTVLGSLLPVLTKLSSLVKDEVAHAFNSLNTYAGAAAGGLSGIGSAVQGVIKWIGDLAAKLNSISIPDWLEGHSPPPMANWFSDIASATAAVNAQLPALQMNLAASLPGGGGSVSNTSNSSRSFTYAPQYTGGGAMEGPMDLALASSLAGV